MFILSQGSQKEKFIEVSISEKATLAISKIHIFKPSVKSHHLQGNISIVE